MRALSLGSTSATATGLSVTGSTNASPIVLTVTAGHDLKTGDRIAIAGVTGNTGANGEWTITYVTATTISLNGSVGNGTHGGTAVAAVVCDTTPFYAGNNAVVMVADRSGAAVFVGTAVVEGADRMDASGFFYDEWATGVRVETAGFTSALGTGQLAIPAATAGGTSVREVKLKRYMRLRTTTTSGGVGAVILA